MEFGYHTEQYGGYQDGLPAERHHASCQKVRHIYHYAWCTNTLRPRGSGLACGDARIAAIKDDCCTEIGIGAVILGIW
jgi:hypothetical protein